MSNHRFSLDAPDDLEPEEHDALDGRGFRSSRNGRKTARDYALDDDRGFGDGEKTRRNVSRHDDGKERWRRETKLREQLAFEPRAPVLRRPAVPPRDGDGRMRTSPGAPRPLSPVARQQSSTGGTAGGRPAVDPGLRRGSSFSPRSPYYPPRQAQPAQGPTPRPASPGGASAMSAGYPPQQNRRQESAAAPGQARPAGRQPGVPLRDGFAGRQPVPGYGGQRQGRPPSRPPRGDAAGQDSGQVKHI